MGERPSTVTVRAARSAVALLAALALLPSTTAPAAADTASLAEIGQVQHAVSGVYISTGTREAFSTPAVADVTGDSTPELVVANLDGVVEAFRLPGRTRLWSANLGRSAIQTSPVLVDLTGDRKPDVVVGTMDGRVVILDGPTGRTVRTFRQGSPLHCPPGQDCRPDGFFATPAVADVNGDGILDIVAPSWDHSVYAWSSRGTLLWRRFLEDTLWSSPVVADIDRNGSPEIILGGDIWPGNNLGKPAGGLVWVLRRDGSTYPGYPRSSPGQVVWSSPAVGDLNGDGNVDIVVGTGNNYPDPQGRRVDAFTARTARSLPGWPVPVDGRVMSSPAIGDLDGDAQLEVAFGSEVGYVYAYDTSGRRIWRTCEARSATSCGGRMGTNGSVAIADVDADGDQEVVSSLANVLRVHDPRSGATEASRSISGRLPAAAPAIAEVGGRTLIAQASFTGAATVVDISTTGEPLCRADWPTFHRDARRSGRLVAAVPTWTPFPCPSDFVAQQYSDFLGRPLDSAGSSYWTAKLRTGTSGSTLIRSFMGSNEFGRVVAPVVRAHFAINGTYPRSAQAVRSGADRLRKGGSVASITDELASAPAIAALDDAAFVTRVFRNLYGRAPTSAELARDTARLRGGVSRGTLASGYAEGSGADRLTAEVNVTMTYLGMLDRVPDPSGWTYWVPATRRRNVDSLVAGFQRSSEYRRRVT